MIQIGTFEYEIGKISAMGQLHLVRKLSRSLPLMEGMIADRNSGKDMRMLAVFMLSNLSDEDSEYVTNKCLDAVSMREKNGQLAKIMSSGGLMFQHIDVSVILELTVEVILHNLGDFFKDALSSLGIGAKS